jgi:hypothetical protein
VGHGDAVRDRHAGDVTDRVGVEPASVIDVYDVEPSRWRLPALRPQLE